MLGVTFWVWCMRLFWWYRRIWLYLRSEICPILQLLYLFSSWRSHRSSEEEENVHRDPSYASWDSTSQRDSNVLKFDVHVTVHRVKFLIINPTRCTNFSNLFLELNSTCFGQFICPSSGVFHCTYSKCVYHTENFTDG